MTASLPQVMWVIGNVIFSILSAKLKNNPDEYLGLLRMMREPENNSKSYKGYCGLSSIGYSEVFKNSSLTEEGLMSNCPDIMVEKPWLPYMVNNYRW